MSDPRLGAVEALLSDQQGRRARSGAGYSQRETGGMRAGPSSQRMVDIGLILPELGTTYVPAERLVELLHTPTDGVLESFEHDYETGDAEGNPTPPGELNYTGQLRRRLNEMDETGGLNPKPLATRLREYAPVYGPGDTERRPIPTRWR